MPASPRHASLDKFRDSGIWREAKLSDPSVSEDGEYAFAHIRSNPPRLAFVGEQDASLQKLAPGRT